VWNSAIAQQHNGQDAVQQGIGNVGGTPLTNIPSEAHGSKYGIMASALHIGS